MGIEEGSARCSKPVEALKEEDQGLRTEDDRDCQDALQSFHVPCSLTDFLYMPKLP
jgi:hypothetical protein